MKATQRAKDLKKLFNLCDSNEGINGKLHVIENTDDGRFPDEKLTYRVYHSDGYCFDITREIYEPARATKVLKILKLNKQ